TAYEGAASTGLTVFEHSVDRVAAHPAIAARRRGHSALCATCRSCPVVRQCGGGLLAHRFRTGSGFGNPSVYCDDLKELILSITRQPGSTQACDPDPTDGPLPFSALDEIATGHVGASTLALLEQLQGQVVEALLEEVADRVGRWSGDNPWDTLVRLSVEAPTPVRAVLAPPYVRTWATACLRSGADPRYLGNVAAAAAACAGCSTEVPGIVHRGLVYLPGLGGVRVDPATDSVTLGVADG